jgi:hypothetical protein
MAGSTLARDPVTDAAEEGHPLGVAEREHGTCGSATPMKQLPFLVRQPDPGRLRLGSDVLMPIDDDLRAKRGIPGTGLISLGLAPTVRARVHGVARGELLLNG